MSTILEDIEKKYFLNFGGYRLSPISAVTVAMMLDYMQDKPGARQPFVINFPNKEGACTPLITGIIINLFFDDYIYHQQIAEFRKELVPGKRIKVFDSVAMIKRKSEKGLVVQFAKEAEYTLSPSSYPFISVSDKLRLTKYADFIDRKKKFFSERNALSIIFEPTQPDTIISLRTFTSKMLLITGRGSLGKTKAAISATRMFNETLSTILKEGENLIIRQDLEEFRGLFDEQNAGKLDRYIQMFRAAYERHKDSLQNNEHIEHLNDLIASALTDTQEYLDTYIQFLEQLDENHPSNKLFRNLTEYHPGLKIALPAGLKAVLINDIYVYDKYRHTINGLLQSGIPVICFCDTIFDSRDSIDFYRTWLDGNQDAWRFGWTREKVIYLNGILQKRTNFIDTDFWNLMLNNAVQKIVWKVSDDGGIENVYTTLSKKIAANDGSDRLRDAWWRYLVPAYYIVKNTPGTINTPEQLLTLFETAAEKSSFGNIEIEIRAFVDMLRNFKQNLKASAHGYSLFRQHIGHIGSYSYEIPDGITDRKNVSGLDPGIKSVFFTGFPYREWIGRELMRAVSEYCIPDISIALWPEEYIATRQYIRSRILAGFFPDHYPGGISFPESLLITDRQLFEEETDRWMTRPTEYNRLFVDHNADMLTPAELYFNVMHKRYITDPRTDETYAVKCNIVYFDNQDLLYLPHSSGLLVAKQHSAKDIEKCYFDELRENDVVYQYRLSRSNLRDLARKNKAVSGAFTIIEKWKNIIRALYTEYESNLSMLEVYCDNVKALHGLGGNPSRQNLQRWLFDEELISPEEDNLQVLMTASGEAHPAEFIKETLAAAQQIRGFTISTAAQIKRAIGSTMGRLTETSGSRQVIVYGKNIAVETRKIIALEKSDIMISYGDTRKIIK